VHRFFSNVKGQLGLSARPDRPAEKGGSETDPLAGFHARNLQNTPKQLGGMSDSTLFLYCSVKVGIQPENCVFSVTLHQKATTGGGCRTAEDKRSGNEEELISSSD